jgi:hypothetical protein
VLLCASTVAAFDPTWLRHPVKELATSLGVRPERVSRLKTKLLRPLEDLVGQCLRRGRPPRDPEDPDASRTRVLEALLAVAADVLGELSSRKRSIQDRLVAARDRLAREHGLPHRSFAEHLGLSPRNLRYWARRGPAPPPSPEPPAKKAPAPRGLGRFRLEATLPGIQSLADTTNWNLLGVPLKVVALQDPGDRHRELWQDFEVDEHEDHEVIVQVLERALKDKPGLQLVSDQGTPYMAQAIEDAYDDLELQHAPQKEAAPTEKATLERSFRTVKEALEPLANLTRKLGAHLPALRSPELAQSLGRLLLAVYLRVYERGRQSSAPSRPEDPMVLEAVAERQRERARAEDRSVKLTLTRIHQAYDFEVPFGKFLRAHRNYPLEDLLEAERKMGKYACRCHARRCDRYYAAVLRQVAAKNRGRRERERRDRLRTHEERRRRRERDAKTRHHDLHPEDSVAQALALLEAQYRTDRDELLFGGIGPGRGMLLAALRHLEETAPLSAIDRAEVGWNLWRRRVKTPSLGCVPHVREIFDRLVQEVMGKKILSTPQIAAAMIGRRSSHTKLRPPPG